MLLVLLLGEEEKGGVPLAVLHDDSGLRRVVVVRELLGVVEGQLVGPSRPSMFGSLFLNIEPGTALSVENVELLLGVLMLLELMLEAGVPMAPDEPESDTGDIPASWNVSFSRGRPFGDDLRTIVVSKGGRNMAVDILCVAGIKVDFVPCPSTDV